MPVVKIPSYDDLKKLSPERRLVLYQNAQRAKDNGGEAVMAAIDASGLPLSSGSLTSDNPVFLRMVDIVWSLEAQAAAIAATEKGLPALCGVDPLLRAQLGDQYTPHDDGTMNAGWVVAQVMRHRGYKEAGNGKCPDGCIAKSGIVWVPLK